MNWVYLALPGILGVLSALHPALGIAAFLASIPALCYFVQPPTPGWSIVTLAALFVTLGASLRLIRIEGFRFLQSGAVLSVIVFLGACFAGAAVRFWDVLIDYPSLLPTNLLTSDQLSPFVFIGETVLWIIGALLYFRTRVAARQENQLRVVFYGLLLQGIAFLGVMAWDVVRHSKPFPGFMFQLYFYNQPSLYAVFNEHNSFAVFCLIQLCLLVGAVVVLRGPARIVAILLLVAYALLVVLALSLSTYLAAGLVVPAGLLLVILRHRGSRLVAALALVILLGAAGALYSQLESSGDFGRAVNQKVSTVTLARVWASTAELRLYPWLVSVNMIREFPILGIGPGRFYQAFSEYAPEIDPGPLWKSKAHENAHNYYLQIGAEMGLAGLIVLLGFVVWTLLRAGWREPIRAAAGMAFAGVAVASLLQHPLLEEPLFFTFVVLAAMVPAGRVSQGASLPALARRRPLQILAGCLVLLFALHLVSAWRKGASSFESGIYGVEKGEKDFRWTSGLALLKRESIESPLVLEFRAHNPDIQVNPLVVTVEQDGRPVGSLELRDHDWHPLRLALEADEVVAIRTSRTFRAVGDWRTLGVTVAGLP